MSTKIIDRPDVGVYVSKYGGPASMGVDRRMVQIDVDCSGGFTQMPWREYAALVREMMKGVEKEEAARPELPS